MPRQSKRRAAADQLVDESSIETILRSIHDCYVGTDGVEAIATDLGEQKIFHPRKKATVETRSRLGILHFAAMNFTAAATLLAENEKLARVTEINDEMLASF